MFAFIPSLTKGDFPLTELNSKQKEQKQRDELRTKEIQEKGYRIWRIWEDEIKQIDINNFKEAIENVTKN